MDSDNENRNEETGDLSRNGRNTLVAKCVMKCITHPLDYARFLVQASHYQIISIVF